MRKTKMLGITLCSVLMMTMVAAKGVGAHEMKSIKVLLNGKELHASTPDTGAVVLDNRVYIPAYLFRQGDITVAFKENILSLTGKPDKYLQNFVNLSNIEMGYMDQFYEMDQEAVKLLGNIILNEPVDSTRLLELLQVVEHADVGFTHWMIIGDTPDGLTQAPHSVQWYRGAIQSLMKYKNNGDREHLRDFYAKREKALEAYNFVKDEVRRYTKLSLVKSVEQL